MYVLVSDLFFSYFRFDIVNNNFLSMLMNHVFVLICLSVLHAQVILVRNKNK